MATEERFDWQKTIKPNIIMLRWVGVWPKEAYKFDIYAAWAAFYLITFLILDICCQAVNMYFILDNLALLTSSVLTFITKVNAAFKAYLMIKNTNLLKNLMITLDCDLFQPRNDKQRLLVEPNLKSWTFFFTAIWTVCNGTLLSYTVLPLFHTEQHLLPIFPWTAYDITSNKLLFWAAYINQAIAIINGGFLNLGPDTLIAGLNVYIGAQYDLLCDNLRNLHLAVDVSCELERCVVHHRRILSFAINSINFFSWLILSQFFVSLLSAAILMFQISLIEPFSYGFWSMFFYLVDLLIQLLGYCWFGNEVLLKSSKIVYATFQCDWIHFSKTTKKKLLFFMLNCQEPFKITALNVFYLVLDNYLRILKTSFSYFTLLQQMNNR